MTNSAVIYLRISKDREGLELGVERHEEDCRALAGRLGLTVSRVFVDNDISASTLSKKKRPQYEEMMTAAEAGTIGVILAYSNSRLTRRPMELERLIAAHERTGVAFHTVVSGHDDLSTADGRMVARIKASVDAAESERQSERIKRQQQQAREQGRWHGGHRAYGRSKDGVSVNDDEAKVVDRLARGVLSGRSVTSLVAELNGEGVPTSTGGRWSSRTLRRVLLRPHPVTADVADVLRTLLDDPSRRTTPGPARRWLLSGLALCGAAGCGGPLLGSGSSLGAGRGTYPAYRCKTGKHTVISAVTLDEFIGAVVVARLQRGDIHQPPAEDLDALHNEAGKLRKRLDELADNLDLDERTLSRRAAALNRKLAAVQGRIAAALSSSPVGDMDGLPPEEFWATRTLERRRAIVDAFMTVTIVAGRRGVIPKAERWRPDLPSFDPLRVQVEWR